MCTFVLEICDRDRWIPLDLDEDVKNILNSKPDEALDNDYVQNLYRAYNAKGSPKDGLIKAVLFSDLHIDFEYTPGNSNNCGNILCCRTDSGRARRPEDAAGRWGDYECDLPEETADSMFDFIRNEIKPDFATWSGDSIPHNLATQTFKNDTKKMRWVTKVVERGLGSIPLYLALGNHDVYP